MIDHPDIDYVHMAKAYGIAAECVSAPDEIRPALDRCKRAMTEGSPYVVDVRIARQYEGADSEFYDFFSVARLQGA